MRMISNRTPEQIAYEEESPNVASMQHLNYTQGLILFGIPVEDRDQFIADNDVGNMSHFFDSLDKSRV
ncbi:DUF3102 domain-containing protein [Desulfosporosinus fructosivorans]|uniref:DUF3102 domain-containing protein n=1 Tax=Desulfosporosinus fructosivorans TaxID=2018669 RepID=UPI001FB08138|nr:DUF3102 domain-containing protein [Desulfosporosinus fructosivorans]